MLQNYSLAERERLIDLFANESLFCSLNSLLDSIDKHADKKTSKVENWLDAKELAQKILNSPNPVFKISILLKNLEDNCVTFDTAFRDTTDDIYTSVTGYANSCLERDAVLLSFMAMMRITEYYNIELKQHHQEIFEAITNYLQDKRVELITLRQVEQVFEKIDKDFKSGKIKHDYDYVHNRPLKTEEMIRAEQNISKETMLAADKTEEPAETQEPAKSPTPSMAENAEDDDPALDLPNRLKVAYILQLLNITSKEQIKNERALCRVLEAITGASRKTVRDYLKTFTLVVAQNKDVINTLNKDLNSLGFPLLKTQLKCE